MRFMVIDSGAVPAILVHAGNDVKEARDIGRRYAKQNPTSIVVLAETSKVSTVEMTDENENNGNAGRRTPNS